MRSSGAAIPGGEPALLPACFCTHDRSSRLESRLAARSGGPTLLLLLFSVVVNGQISLFSFDGTTESPVGPTYSYGNVSSGDLKDVRFRARNLGNSAIQITTVTVSGSGFSRSALNGVVPSTVAPGSFLEFTIRFSAGSPASYSANLQVNSTSVLLLATSVAAPTVTVLPACSPGSGNGANFPNVTIGTTGLCNFSLQNPNPQPIDITTLSVKGDSAFHGPDLSIPFTLKPNDAITFAIQFTPVCGTLNYSATLNVNGRSFPLAGTGLTPPLPKPSLIFDAPKIASGEQHTVSMTLPSPAVCPAAGNLNLAFSGSADDRSIFFLSGSTRTLPFSVKAGDTQATINGQSSARFQTGTTAGTITFSLSGTPIAADATATVAISPAPIVIETATASNQRTGQLDIQVVGYDNTYTAGSMSFTFFDTSGNQIGSPVPADFTSNFKSFYSGITTGSTFLMRVSFPVQGDQKQVGKVQVTLANSAGQAQTGLTFQ